MILFIIFPNTLVILQWYLDLFVAANLCHDHCAYKILNNLHLLYGIFFYKLIMCDLFAGDKKSVCPSI